MPHIYIKHVSELMLTLQTYGIRCGLTVGLVQPHCYQISKVVLIHYFKMHFIIPDLSVTEITQYMFCCDQVIH